MKLEQKLAIKPGMVAHINPESNRVEITNIASTYDSPKSALSAIGSERFYNQLGLFGQLASISYGGTMAYYSSSFSRPEFQTISCVAGLAVVAVYSFYSSALVSKIRNLNSQYAAVKELKGREVDQALSNL